MTGKIEFVLLDVVFVDRSSNQGAYPALNQIVHSVLQGQQRIFSAGLIFFAERKPDIFLPDVDHVRPLAVRLLRRLDNMKAEVIYSQCFTMKRSNFGISINDRSEIFQYTVIR